MHQVAQRGARLRSVRALAPGLERLDLADPGTRSQARDDHADERDRGEREPEGAVGFRVELATRILRGGREEQPEGDDRDEQHAGARADVAQRHDQRPLLRVTRELHAHRERRHRVEGNPDPGHETEAEQPAEQAPLAQSRRGREHPCEADAERQHGQQHQRVATTEARVAQ